MVNAMLELNEIKDTVVVDKWEIKMAAVLKIKHKGNSQKLI